MKSFIFNFPKQKCVEHIMHCGRFGNIIATDNALYGFAAEVYFKKYFEIWMIYQADVFISGMHLGFFYSNIIGTCGHGYRRAKKPLFHYWIEVFNRLSHWFIVVFNHILNVVASNFMRHEEGWEYFFYLIACILQSNWKLKWNDGICLPSNYMQKIFDPFHITAKIGGTNR